MHVVVSFALLFVVVAAQSQFNTRVSDGLVALYKFQDGQTNPTALAASDSAGSLLGDIVLNDATSNWPAQNAGLEFPSSAASLTGLPRGVSAADTTGVLNAINVAGEFSIEMWIRPATSSQSETFIAGFGDFTPDQNGAGVCSVANGNGGWAFVQNAVEIGVDFFFTSGGGTVSCGQGSQIALTAGNQLVHAALSYSNTQVPKVSFEARREGQAATEFPFTSSPAGTPLQPLTWPITFLNLNNKFQDGGTPVDAWQGEIYMIAIYDRYLNRTEVDINFNAGLPDSFPFANDVDVTGDEDTLFNITLSATDADGDELEFIVDSLPNAGTVFNYTSDGGIEALTAGDLPALVSQPIAYQGALNSFADVTFTYSARERLTTEKLESLSKIVRVTLNPVNDAPVPTPQTATATLGLTRSIQLSGTDVEDGATVSGAFIQSLPTRGELFQTVDGVTPTEQITSGMLPARVNSSSLRVIYRSTSVEDDETGRLVLYEEAFSFSVFDSEGLNSTSSAAVTVEVQNFLVANVLNQTVSEDAQGTLTFSVQVLGVTANLSFILESLPQQGLLYQFGDVGNGTQLTADDLPVTVTDSQGRMTYVPPANEFGNNFADIRFFANDTDSGFRSGSTFLGIDVSDVNDPPELEGPTQVFEVTAGVSRQPFSFNLSDIDSDTSTYRTRVGGSVAGPVLLDPSRVSGLSFTEPPVYDPRNTIGVQTYVFFASKANTEAALKNLTFVPRENGPLSVEVIVCDSTIGTALAPDAQCANFTVRFQAALNPNDQVTVEERFSPVEQVLIWCAIGICPFTLIAVACARRYRRWEHEKDRTIQKLPLCIHCVLSQWNADIVKNGDKYGHPPTIQDLENWRAEHERLIQS